MILFHGTRRSIPKVKERFHIFVFIRFKTNFSLVPMFYFQCQFYVSVGIGVYVGISVDLGVGIGVSKSFCYQ